MSMEIGNGRGVSEAGASGNPSVHLPAIHRENEPVALFRATADSAAFPLEFLGPIHEPVQAIATLTNAPIELAMQAVLATCALMAQEIADVELISGTSPTSLFLMSVAPSGERKSAVHGLANKPIAEWEATRAPEYAEQLEEYDFACELHKKQKLTALKVAADDTSVVENVRPQKPVPPVSPTKLHPDLTYEGLLKHFEAGTPSVAIFSDEGGQFFGGPGMSRENQLKTSTGLSKLWDGDAVARTRAGSIQRTFRSRRASLHLMVQPKIAETIFSDEILKDQGFLSRLLIAYPKSLIGTRVIHETVETEEARETAKTILGRYNARINKQLEVRQDTCFDALEVQPRVLRLSPDARANLVHFANEVEARQAPFGPFAHITGFASKAAEHAARVAAVLTLYEDVDAQEINEDIMICALKIVSWHLREAQRLLCGGYVDPDTQMAQTLLDWLRAKFANAPFDKRTICRFGPPSLRDTEKISKLLRILEKHGQIAKRANGAEIDGKTVRAAWDLSIDA